LVQNTQASVRDIKQRLEQQGFVLDRHRVEKHVGEIHSAGLESKYWRVRTLKWTPRDLFRDAEARKHFRKSTFCWVLFWWTW
jgi:hypothetical protein